MECVSRFLVFSCFVESLEEKIESSECWHILILATKVDYICFSKPVSQTSRIYDEYLEISPGHYIGTRDPSKALTGRDHNKSYWRLPSGKIDYIVINVSLNPKFFKFF